MYRENVGPKPPDPWASAEQNAKTMGWIQIGSVGLQAFSLLLMLMQFGPGMQLAFMSGEAKLWTLLGIVGYLAFMGAWAGLNAWGLRKRSKIAHWSTFVFAVSQILCCFGWVFGAGLMFLLFKREMKGYYDVRPTS
jgi:hypothetical protein